MLKKGWWCVVIALRSRASEPWEPARVPGGTVPPKRRGPLRRRLCRSNAVEVAWQKASLDHSSVYILPVVGN